MPSQRGLSLARAKRELRPQRRALPLQTSSGCAKSRPTQCCFDGVRKLRHAAWSHLRLPARNGCGRLTRWPSRRRLTAGFVPQGQSRQGTASALGLPQSTNWGQVVGADLVAAFVRKQSRLRARQGRDRGRSALGAEVWRLVHPSAESAQMQQRRRERCNSIGAEADGSHLDNAANRPGCEIGGRPRRVSAAGIRSRARASM
jgi:hypothetical protein